MPTLRRFLRDDSGPDTDAVRAELHGMLPGMLVEQTAAVILENVNVYVMGFISTAALAGVSQVTTINNILMNLFQAFATGGTVMVACCSPPCFLPSAIRSSIFCSTRQSKMFWMPPSNSFASPV